MASGSVSTPPVPAVSVGVCTRSPREFGTGPAWRRMLTAICDLVTATPLAFRNRARFFSNCAGGDSVAVTIRSCPAKRMVPMRFLAPWEAVFLARVASALEILRRFRSTTGDFPGPLLA